MIFKANIKDGLYVVSKVVPLKRALRENTLLVYFKDYILKIINGNTLSPFIGYFSEGDVNSTYKAGTRVNNNED